MREANKVVYHFLNLGLYAKFIKELSADKFIRLLKQDQKLLKKLFAGCRVNSQSFSLPIVQGRIKNSCGTNQILRNFLCEAWLATKISLVTYLHDYLPFSFEGESTDVKWWVDQIHEIQNKHGHEKITTEIVKALVWAETNPDDIRILISILGWAHEDQEGLARYVDKTIELSKKDPKSYLDFLVTKIDEDNKVIKEFEDKKQKMEEERSKYNSKLDESRSTSDRDRKDFEKRRSNLQSHESEIQENIKKLNREVNKFENALGKIQSDRSQLEQKYKKTQRKAEYEQNKIVEETTNLDEEIGRANNIIAVKRVSAKNKTMIKGKTEQNILARKQETKKQTLRRKVQIKEPVTQRDKGAPKTILEVRDELKRIMSFLGRIEPLRKNETGVVVTPSTLDIVDYLSTAEFEPPMETPSQPQSTNDIVGHVDYWKYQAVWGSDKWNNTAIVNYSLWRSRQLQRENVKLAAELALSGLFHAELDFGSDQINLLLLQFLEVIGGVDSIGREQDDYDDLIKKLLQKILEEWENKPLIVVFLGQLALISPQKLGYILEIADVRSRIFLKRALVKSFEGFLALDEYDPSHEMTHLITLSLEQKESRLRSACSRWMVQDSVDAMAQNARHGLMASIAQFPNIGQRETSLLLDEFESQVSTPLSEAISSGVPEAFEHLSLQCFTYAKEITAGRSWVQSVYLWPCVIHLAGQALEANILAKRMFRAALEVSTDKQFYPLNVSERPCSVEVIINNHGNTDARDLNAVILSSRANDDVDVQGGEPTFSVLKPGNEVSHKIQIRLTRDTQACVLEYILNWKDSSSIDERSQTGTLKLLSQKEVDWDKAQNPYSLKSVKDPARLKGRSDVMNTLRRSLNSMDSYYITGQRRTGKSSVAQVYYKELNEKSTHAAIYLWWGDLGTTLLTPICHAICYELAQKLRERTHKDVISCPSMSDFSGNENFMFKTFFSQVHTHLPDWKFFIIIDDFDELPASFHETAAGDRFFLLLRALLDQEFVALYLVGSEKLPEILKRQGERLNLNQRCEIDYLKEPSEIHKIIVEPAMNILEFNREATEEISNLSAGNPYYSTLICSRLFNDMARVKDYYVSKRDVERSTESIIEEDVLSTYQHFWKDGVFLPGRLGERQQYHNAKVLIALSRAQTAEGSPVSKEQLMKRDDLAPLDRKDAEYALSGLLDRKVVIEDERGLYVRVPLFRKWLARSGARAVDRSFAEAGLDEAPINIARGLSTRELIDVAQDLVYQDKEVNEVQIADWLSQFGGISNQLLAFKMLKRLREEGYFNQARMFSAFKEINKQIVSIEASTKEFAPRAERKSIVNVIVSYLDPAGKSGHACEYNYRKVNHIHSKCAIVPDKLIDLLTESKGHLPIIFADDIIGTGGTISEGFLKLSMEMTKRGLDVSNYSFYLAAVVGTKVGQAAVENATEGCIQIILGHEIDERLQAFSEGANLFSDKSERLAAKEMVEKIGKELEPKHPLGRENGELLVLFQHGCPNNTLPIFYKSGRTFRGREWRPLFPR